MLSTPWGVSSNNRFLSGGVGVLYDGMMMVCANAGAPQTGLCPSSDRVDTERWVKGL